MNGDWWLMILNMLLIYFTMVQVVFYKRLSHVFFIEAIPKAPSGKILRKELRAKLATGIC